MLRRNASQSMHHAIQTEINTMEDATRNILQKVQNIQQLKV